jgi:phage tail protein X
MADDVIHARQGDTLDELVWRERRLGPTNLGALLDANVGVARLGAVLPLGTPIRIPASAPAAATRDVVNLWD